MNVSRLMRGFSIAVLSLGVAAASYSTASAEGFAISSLSARGAGLGGGAASGMVARADDASVVAFNPAGMVNVPGTQVMAGLAGVALNLDVEIDAVPGATDGHWMSNSHQVWPIPHGYLTHQVNDKLSLGVGMFTRWGLGHSYPDHWGVSAGVQNSVLLKSITLLTSTLNPSVAYKVNDVWSVGGGVSYSWGYLSLNQQANIMYGAERADVRIHSENGHSFGYNLGLHAQFNDQWSAGLTYRSHERMKFNGNARVRSSGIMGGAIAEAVVAGGGIINGRGKATLVLPDVITLGVAYRPTERMSFELDTAYTVWSRWRNLNVDMLNYPNELGGGIHQTKNWRDTWAFSVSAEYWMYDWLALRAGFLYETSPLNGEAYHDYLIPTNGRLQFSTGLGLKYQNWTLDFAYIYMMEREVNLVDHDTNGDGTGVMKSLNGKFGNGYDHTFALTLGYKF